MNALLRACVLMPIHAASLSIEDILSNVYASLYQSHGSNQPLVTSSIEPLPMDPCDISLPN